MKIVFILLMFLVSEVSYGQNVLFEEGQSGFGLGIDYDPSDSNFSLAPSYTINGKLTLQLIGGASLTNFNELLTIGGQAKYLLVRQNEYIPVSVNTNVAYGISFISELDNQTLRLLTFGTTLHRQFSIEKFDIIPSMGLSWGRLTAEINEIEINESRFILGLGTVIKFGRFYLEPSYVFVTKDLKAFNLAGGMLF